MGLGPKKKKEKKEKGTLSNNFQIPCFVKYSLMTAHIGIEMARRTKIMLSGFTAKQLLYPYLGSIDSDSSMLQVHQTQSPDTEHNTHSKHRNSPFSDKAI